MGDGENVSSIVKLTKSEQEEIKQHQATVLSNPNLEISQSSSRGVTGMGTEAEDEISRLINESYQLESDKDLSAVFKDDKLFDQPKKAIYGI